MFFRLWLLFISMVFSPLFCQEYVIRYQYLTSGSLYNLETPAGEKLACVVRTNINGKIHHYTLLDNDDLVLALGISEENPSETFVHILDGPEKTVGYIDFKTHPLLPKEFRLFNAQGQLIALGSMNWVGSAFSLVDPDDSNKVLAHFFRPMFKLFYDNWHFELVEPALLDLRLLTILGVLETACSLYLETYDLAIGIGYDRSITRSSAIK